MCIRDSLGVGLAGSGVDASGLLDQNGCRRSLGDEAEGAVSVHGNDDGDHIAHLVLGTLVELLGECHDVDTLLTQSRANSCLLYTSIHVAEHVQTILVVQRQQYLAVAVRLELVAPALQDFFFKAEAVQLAVAHQDVYKRQLLYSCCNPSSIPVLLFHNRAIITILFCELWCVFRFC